MLQLERTTMACRLPTYVSTTPVAEQGLPSPKRSPVEDFIQMSTDGTEASSSLFVADAAAE